MFPWLLHWFHLFCTFPHSSYLRYEQWRLEYSSALSQSKPCWFPLRLPLWSSQCLPNWEEWSPMRKLSRRLWHLRKKIIKINLDAAKKQPLDCKRVSFALSRRMDVLYGPGLWFPINSSDLSNNFSTFMHGCLFSQICLVITNESDRARARACIPCSMRASYASTYHFS